jgi:hypothetical protein
MIFRILGVGALLALAGCQSITPEERRAADEATCRSYGFTERNDAFAECLQRIDLDRRAQARANLASLERSRPFVVYQPVPVRVRD